MEAECSVTEQTDLVVRALEASVGEGQLESTKDTFAVVANGTSELHEWGEARARGPGEPGLEPFFGVLPTVANREEVEEALLEQIGSIERIVQLGERGESTFLVGLEAVGSLEEDPAQALCGFAAGGCLRDALDLLSLPIRTALRAFWASWARWKRSKTISAPGRASRTAFW
jgi:hypothetical protein